MKRIIFLTFIISALIFSGCTNKGNVATTKNDDIISTNITKAQTKNSTTNQSQDSSKATSTETSKTVVTSTAEKSQETQPNFKPLKPGTIPQLTSAQKAQINGKLDSAISSINSSLNSLDNINDVDLSSIN